MFYKFFVWLFRGTSRFSDLYTMDLDFFNYLYVLGSHKYISAMSYKCLLAILINLATSFQYRKQLCEVKNNRLFFSSILPIWRLKTLPKHRYKPMIRECKIWLPHRVFSSKQHFAVNFSNASKSACPIYLKVQRVRYPPPQSPECAGDWRVKEANISSLSQFGLGSGNVKTSSGPGLEHVQNIPCLYQTVQVLLLLNERNTDEKLTKL